MKHFFLYKGTLQALGEGRLGQYVHVAGTCIW